MATINVKVNREWKQLDSNSFGIEEIPETPVPTDQVFREPCIELTGSQLREALGVSESDDLWMEVAEDGLGDPTELVVPDGYGTTELYSIFDDTRFFTAARKINGGD